MKCKTSLHYGASWITTSLYFLKFVFLKSYPCTWGKTEREDHVHVGVILFAYNMGLPKFKHYYSGKGRSSTTLSSIISKIRKQVTIALWKKKKKRTVLLGTFLKKSAKDCPTSFIAFNKSCGRTYAYQKQMFSYCAPITYWVCMQTGRQKSIHKPEPRFKTYLEYFFS